MFRGKCMVGGESTAKRKLRTDQKWKPRGHVINPEPSWTRRSRAPQRELRPQYSDTVQPVLRPVWEHYTFPFDTATASFEKTGKCTISDVSNKSKPAKAVAVKSYEAKPKRKAKERHYKEPEHETVPQPADETPIEQSPIYDLIIKALSADLEGRNEEDGKKKVLKNLKEILGETADNGLRSGEVNPIDVVDELPCTSWQAKQKASRRVKAKKAATNKKKDPRQPGTLPADKRPKEQEPEILDIAAKWKQKYEKSTENKEQPKLRACCELEKTVLLQNFKKRGWKLVNSDSDWDFFWGSLSSAKNMFSLDSAYRMRDFQIFNHFPNQFEISRKDFLCKNIKKYRKELKRLGDPIAERTKDGRYKYLDFIPITFTLPVDYGIFVEEYRKNPKSIWIMKPCNKSQGAGIFLVNNLSKLKQWSPRATRPRENYMISKYIENPLLIGGKKFDLRLYVVVLSFHPLKAYRYKQGICRFCSVRYDSSLQQMDNMLVHLTNVSIQQHGRRYNEYHGGKWSLQNLLLYLEGTFSAGVADRLLDSIHSVMLHSLRAVAPAISNDRHCFELYGYDIIIDDDLKPWLIEINSAPSLTTTTYNDRILKLKLIEDVLNVVLPPNGVPNVRWNKVPHADNLGDFELLVDDKLPVKKQQREASDVRRDNKRPERKPQGAQEFKRRSQSKSNGASNEGAKWARRYSAAR